MPFISICIPAYKRVDFLKRLLDSISIQTFRDFEVIVTDDSPGAEVKSLCGQFINQFPLIYHQNHPALGTPENWNEAIRRAKGEWIKIMHDDDWFASYDSLAKFASAATSIGKNKLIFSDYWNVDLGTGNKTQITKTAFRLQAMARNPVSILSENIIGPPSNTMYSSSIDVYFDRNLKWLVDIEFYIRVLKQLAPAHINQPLVYIGIHHEQVTASSSLRPEIEIPEHLYLAEKLGEHAFRNLPYYDAFWRMIRNLRIRSVDQLKKYAGEGRISPNVQWMVQFQQRIPHKLLRLGVFSKLIMLISYLISIIRK